MFLYKGLYRLTCSHFCLKAPALSKVEPTPAPAPKAEQAILQPFPDLKNMLPRIAPQTAPAAVLMIPSSI